MVTNTAERLLGPRSPAGGRVRSEFQWRQRLAQQARVMREVANEQPKATAVAIPERAEIPWAIGRWFFACLFVAAFGLFDVVAVVVAADAPLPFVIGASLFLCGCVLAGISYAVLRAWLRANLL